MLSLARIGKGAAAYYCSLDQDHSEQAGTTQLPTPFWLGSGAEQLGLTETVHPETFHRLFEGFHPTRPEALVRNAGSPLRRPGWDCCFSADKSLSAFWALADPETRRAIEQCQWEAVRRAMNALEQNCAVSRLGAGGAQRVPALILSAAFPHGASRNRDPQLHTHALVLNVGMRPDGSTGALTTRPIFQAKLRLGTLYRVELALQLTYRLGLETRWDGSLFQVSGVPEVLQDHFSSRRETILTALEEKGLSGGGRAAAVTCLQTRPDKQEPGKEQLFRQWQETGRAYGFGAMEAERLLHRHQPQVAIETARTQWQEAALQALSQEQEVQRLEAQEQHLALLAHEEPEHEQD